MEAVAASDQEHISGGRGSGGGEKVDNVRLNLGRG